MPELPEATVLAGQLDRELRGQTIAAVTLRQPKCLNVPVEQFVEALLGNTCRAATARGKWVVVDLADRARLCLNLGMGGQLLLHDRGEELPEKWAARFDFTDGRTVTIGFSWFGYIHLAGGPATGAPMHPVDELGPTPLEMDLERFRAVLAASKGAAIKSILLDQRRVSGIGNVMVQDPLWLAEIHPLRKAGSLNPTETESLFGALTGCLSAAIAHNGSRYEKDFYGQYGSWGGEHFLVGYREGEACPRCGAAVEKIKTGSTSSYICPVCQRLAE